MEFKEHLDKALKYRGWVLGGLHRVGLNDLCGPFQLLTFNGAPMVVGKTVGLTKLMEEDAIATATHIWLNISRSYIKKIYLQKLKKG